MATNLADRQMDMVRRANIPVFETPYRCVRAVNALVKYHHFLDNKKHGGSEEQGRPRASLTESVPATGSLLASLRPEVSVRKDGHHVLTELEAHPILQSCGIRVPRSGLAHDEREALAIAEEIGYPVVVKVESPDILHRSDAAAIRLGIRTSEELLNAYHQVTENARRYDAQARLKGVSVVEMLPEGGVECLIGTLRDADFGWMVMFGLGGVFVEVLRDVSMRVTPLTHLDAQAMVEEIRGYPILHGARGREEADVAALIDSLLNVSRFLEEYGEQIVEFEINPLVVFPKGKGAVAADCLLVLK